MAKITTPANTGLSIKRENNNFTASWKMRVSSSKMANQWARYRTYNGSTWSTWTTKSVGKGATSLSFTLSASAKITQIQVQTQARQTGKKFVASAWGSSSAIYNVTQPNAPTLTKTINSANSTTFSWTHDANDSSSEWFYRCYYRTKCDDKPDSESGWGAWTYAATGSYTYTDSGTGTTRIFQIKAEGPGGSSTVLTEQHYIGKSPIATWSGTPVSLTTESSYYTMTYGINLNGTEWDIDDIKPQYFIGTPSSSMGVPSGSTWTDGTSYNYKNSQTEYALAITTTALVDVDECLWARVKTTHDSIESYSTARLVLAGALTAPIVSVSMGTILSTGFTVNITVSDAGTDVPGAYMQVFLEKFSAMGLENYILIGTIANGSASASITSTENLVGESGYAIHVRNITADGVSMKSGFYTYKTTMPTPPTLNSVTATTTSGKVYLSWTNNWSDATGAIIAWTDDPDNWMSNEEPETYEIKEVASNWYITGLETGKTWYFRIRSVKEETETDTLSPWSADVSIDLSSAPAVPALYLSDETITEGGMVTAYWSYVSTDGTGQISGNIVTATYSGGVWSYGSSVGATTTAQHIDIYAADHNWTNGTVKYLALQTRAGSGGMSEYSTPVKLVVADKPTVTISSTGLSSTETLTERMLGDGATTTFLVASSISASPTVTVGGTAATVSSYSGSTFTLSAAPDDGDEIVITYTTTENKVLTSMPMTATVATTNSATLTVAIERAMTYPMHRPDGTETEGAIGETVYVSTIPAQSSNSISISNADLIGRLDDGAWYNFIVTASDEFGQSAEASILFKVHWSHQAWAPTATFITDDTNYIARITPIAGADYVSGDVCDIYRLSADQSELIYSGAAFGTEYVDPYPAFGTYSGYKVVTVTANNDYITEDNDFAEYDTTGLTVYTQLDIGDIVIDFGGDRVELPYNITLGNSWAKDFERTTYLGGHVTGDHNKAVLRDLSSSTVLVRDLDDEMAAKMRALSRYTGLCHVRTPEGSSFVADVQVSEEMSHNTPIINYSLSIQKVDTVGFDGMTYAEWQELNEEES